ncbi:MAG: hypothetical protein EA401_04205 [Planctomycetota bacterium]|nr:MAG: hypothetical protein EA401_04205 [Planctomycetota bacterium]
MAWTRPVAAVALGSAVLLAAACSITLDEHQGRQNTNSPGQPAPEGSIAQLSDTGTSAEAVWQINEFRRQAFGNDNFDLRNSRVLYTAALRHAGYLDSINSREGISGPAEDNVPLNSAYVSLLGEEVMPLIPELNMPSNHSDPVWPAMFTHTELRSRVLAVRGGRDLLQANSGAVSLSEHYWFDNAGPLLTLSGRLSDFRSVARPQYGRFDLNDAESLWHNPLARPALMRPSVRHLGVANKFDARSKNGNNVPPFPLFNGAFGGVMISAEERSPVTVTAMSFWPSDGLEGVSPWGFDGPRRWGDDQRPLHPHYSGPVLHVTLPTTEPINVLRVAMNRVQSPGSTASVGGNVLNASSVEVSAAVPLNVYVANNQALSLTQLGDSDFEVTLAPNFQLYNGDDQGGADNAEFLVQNAPVRAISDTEIDDDFVLGRIRFPAALPAEVQIGDLIQISGDIPPGLNIGTKRILEIGNGRRELIVEPRFGFDELEVETIFAIDGDDAETGVFADIFRFDDDGSESVLRNGEIMMIPSEPLVPGAWYRVAVYARSTAAGIDFREEGTIDSPKQWWFRVADKPIPRAAVP